MPISHLFQLATKVVNLLDETGDDAGDFEINPDQTNIQTAANDAEAVIVVSYSSRQLVNIKKTNTVPTFQELYDTAEKLAPEYADDIALEKTDVEEADADMNNKDANSPLRPRKVSRVFKA